MIPLADRLRPANLDDYVGQKHLIGPDKLLTKSIQNNQLFSMILWGPPGVGKTSLARLIARNVDADFLEFSAVTTGIAELKKIFEQIRESRTPSLRSRVMTDSGEAISEIATQTSFARDDKEVIVFIDEIHRFNKAQQDALLPYVENGTITLIGATTENPSFEIIPPLLSRTRVFVLEQLTPQDLHQVIERALKDKVNGLGNFKVTLEPFARDFLLEGAAGDARSILNTLEIAVLSKSYSAPTRHPELVSGSQLKFPKIKLTKPDIEEAFQKRALAYDKGGEEHYNTISAFIKSMRASQPDAAIYYLARMIEAGEDPLFIARRMVIFASEDIGLAQPTALVVANEVFRSVETIGYPECGINLAHGVAYLSNAKKDRSAYDALQMALNDVRQFGNLPIPMNIRNAPTKLLKDLGYGKDYQKYTDESYLPTKLRNKKYLKTND